METETGIPLRRKSWLRRKWQWLRDPEYRRVKRELEKYYAAKREGQV